VTIEPNKGGPEASLGQYARRVSPDSSVWYLGSLWNILADAQETNGQFSVIEILAPEGLEPPRHVHYREDESFYVLEGDITYYVGEETYEASPGTFVFLPRGVPHSFTFETETIRMLTILAPAGIEAHFRDPRFGEPARELTLPPPAAPPDIAAFAEDLARYGVEIVGPPGPPERA
jgi:quercetin dioxygenase-like cupin family protein